MNALLESGALRRGRAPRTDDSKRSEPLVAIRNLKLEASTARGTVLRGIDLDIRRGRILGVVGESGSGKSSLASCLLRLLPANISHLSGEIVFDGTDLLASTRQG